MYICIYIYIYINFVFIDIIFTNCQVLMTSEGRDFSIYYLPDESLKIIDD